MNAYTGPEGQEDMPYLLTPGPVTTSRAVKIAMLADYGARDAEFAQLVRHVRLDLKRIAGCSGDHACVLLQGPGTYAMEAALGSFCPARRKKTLVICNGAYGERAVQILGRIGRPFVRLAYRETTMPRASDVVKTLDEDKTISHVWMVHCETSTGMLNPLKEIAEIVKARGRFMMVDAISSFGGVPLNMVDDGIDVLVSSASNCLEAVPGIAFVIAKRSLLEASAGECHSLSLDLHTQWAGMEKTGQFRFTPPTHVLVALREALREFAEEGGVDGRSQRYRRNADSLRERLKALGLSLLLPDVEASPIIQTVLAPRAATFEFQRFANALLQRGFAVAPGALDQRPSFRIGCIGKVNEKIVLQLVSAIEDVMNKMDVRSFAPADA